MSRFNVMPRTYRLRAWICDRIAPPGWVPHDLFVYRYDHHDRNPYGPVAKDDPVTGIIPPEAYEWTSPPADMPPAPTAEQLLRKLEAKDST